MFHCRQNFTGKGRVGLGKMFVDSPLLLLEGDDDDSEGEREVLDDRGQRAEFRDPGGPVLSPMCPVESLEGHEPRERAEENAARDLPPEVRLLGSPESPMGSHSSSSKIDLAVEGWRLLVFLEALVSSAAVCLFALGARFAVEETRGDWGLPPGFE